MAFQHQELASGKWQKLSLLEQLGNIGSEVGRARRFQGKDDKLYNAAVERALELFDLTLSDQRWKGRWREIARAREIFLDAAAGGKEFNTSLEDLDKYFLPFALAARRDS